MTDPGFHNHTQQLMRQWRFAQLRELAEKPTKEDPGYWQGRYSLFECYLARAEFFKAEMLFREIDNSIDKGSELYTSLLLKYHLLALQTYQSEDMSEAFRYFEGVSADTLTSGYNRALAYLLHGKAILLGISFGILSSRLKNQAIRFLQDAAVAFKKAGFINEWQSTLLLLAETFYKKPYPNPVNARKTYEELYQVALSLDDHLGMASARLGLAELNLEEQFKPGVTNEVLKELMAGFEKIPEIFDSGHHLLGHTVVKHRFGTLLLRYGMENGLELLEEAANEYENQGFLTEQQMLIREISSWHLHHGNAQENIEAEQKATLLNTKVTVPFGGKVSALAKIELAHRQGNIGHARQLYEKAVVAFRNHPLLGQLESLHAGNLAKAGLLDDALVIYRKIVERAAPLQASGFLSDAYFNLGANLMNTNPQEAEVYIARAIKIDEELGDELLKVNHIQLYIQVLANKQLRQSGPPLQITPEINVCFDECARILRENHSVDAVIRLAETLQTKARILFLARKPDDAIDTYREAATVIEPAKLFSHLSFLYAHHGMALVEKARQQKNVQYYDEACDLFQRALTLFEKGMLKAEQARMLGLTGICEYEAGRLEPAATVSEARYDRAENAFEKAYAINRYLRIHTDHSTELSRQRSMIAFIEQNQIYVTQAFYMHGFYTHNTRQAVKWLERTKAQALMESLVARQNRNARSEASPDVNWIDTHDRYQDIADRLREQITGSETLIVQFFCTTDRVVVFGIRKDWPEPRMETLLLNYQQLVDCAEQHFSINYGNVKSMLGYGMENDWQRFNILVKPIENWSKPGERIYLIPHVLLHQLPLHTLKTAAGKYLIERNPVSYCQSLSLLHYMGTTGPVNGKENYPAFVFGDSRDNLPFARQEAEAVSDVLNTSAILGSNVTREAVIDALPACSILHICGHGELSEKDGWDYGMQMAGGSLLTAADVFSSVTSANLVVLSGCETGISEYATGDELSGLVRSFLHAGSGSLIVSQWKVDDAATAELFRYFYMILRERPNLRVMEAMREAMLIMYNTGKNFYYWGAFQVFSKL